MTQARVPQVAFSAGWLDPLLHAREDFQRHQSGLAHCEGFVPLRGGGVTRCPGTDYLGDAASATCRLLPFVFAANDAVMLEFTPGRLRFWRYGVPVTRNGGVVEVGTPYTTAAQIAALRIAQDADVAYLANGLQPVHVLRRYALDSWALEEWTDLVGPFLAENTDEDKTIRVFDADAATGTLPWAAGAFLNVGTVVKAGSRIYEYRGVGATAGDGVAGTTGPTMPTHTSGTVATGDGSGGNVWWRFIADTVGSEFVTLYAQGSVFDPSHVGGAFALTVVDWNYIPLWTGNVELAQGTLIRNAGNVYEVLSAELGGGGVSTGVNPPVHTEGTVRMDTKEPVRYRFVSGEIGVVRITAVVNAGQATAQVIEPVPQPLYDDGTYRWAAPAWTSANGYPAALALYQQRLWAAASPSEPSTVWASEQGLQSRFVLGDLDTDALAYDLSGGGDRNAILWMFSGRRGLYTGTLGGVRLLNPGGEILSASSPPTNNVVSTVPASEALPIAPHGWPIYITLDRTQLLETRFDLASDQVRPVDLTLTGQHLARSGIDRIEWLPGSQGLLYAATSGTLLCLIYEPDQDIVGWARVPIGGYVRDIVSLPSANARHYELYAVVDRAGRQCMERLPDLNRVLYDAPTANYAMSAVTLSAEPAATEFRVAHLAGQTVAAQANGWTWILPVNAEGQLVLPEAASSVRIGLVPQALMDTLALVAPARDGDSRGRLRRVENGIGLHVWDAGGGAVELMTRDRGETPVVVHQAELLNMPALSDPASLRSGILRVDAITPPADEVFVRIRARDVQPLTVLGVFVPIDEAGP